MVYILTISNATKNDKNKLGDVVSIQETHPTATEYQKFDIYEINDTIENVMNERKSILPIIKLVWEDGDNLKEITQEPLFKITYKDGKFTHNYNEKNSTVIGTKIK